MQIKLIAVLILSTISAILFIRASIVPFFAVYGDPLDEMFMSAISLISISAAFILTARKGSFVAGPVMALIGGFYGFNGYRLLGLISGELASDSNGQGMFAANIYTILIGAALLGLGIFSLVRRLRKKNENLKSLSVDI